MNRLSDKYDFKIITPDGQIMDVIPVSDRMTWRTRFDPRIGVYVEELDFPFDFIDTSGDAFTPPVEVFKTIYTWERNKNGRCARWYIQAIPKCVQGPEDEIVWSPLYNYSTPVTSGVPVPGDLIQPDDSPNILLVHKTDSEGGDQSLNLEQITAGSTVQWAGGQIWVVTGVVDSGDYMTLTVTPSIQEFPDQQQRFIFTIPEGVAERIWQGMFTVKDCRFHVEQCRVEIQPVNTGSWQCLVDSWTEPINLVETPPIPPPDIGRGTTDLIGATCATTFPGTAEDFPTVESMFDIITNHPELQCEDLALWSVKQITAIFDDVLMEWTVSVQYFRERVFSTTEPPFDNGEPWTESPVGTWTRKPDTTCNFAAFFAGTDFGSGPVQALFQRVTCQVSRFQQGHRQLVRMLNETIQYHFDKLCPGQTIRSHFLGLNEGGPITPPTNAAYTFANDWCRELGMISAHDTCFVNPISGVVLPHAELDFDISDFTFQDVIDDLIKAFNLKLTFLVEEQTWYLEHVSMVIGANGMNLINPENESKILGTWVYDYENVNVPKFETFKWSVETDDDPDFVADANRNFDGYPIEYSGDCVTIDAADIARELKIFFTNYDDLLFQYEEAIILSNLDANQTEDVFTLNQYYESKAFCLVAFKDGDAFSVSSCLPSTTGGTNVKLGFPCLHQSLWLWDRLLETGRVNQNPVVFSSVIKQRIQDDIIVGVCCGDYFNKFSPNNLVRTQLGWGEIDEAVFEEPIEKLTLKLRHD